MDNKKNNKHGCFIAIEGTDGSGKSTQLKNVIAYLDKQGYDLVVTREPGGTSIGEQIRQVLLDTENAAMHARTEMLLYAASRAQHVEEKILPGVKAGKVVVTDRYVGSSIAYQGFGRGLGDIVAQVNEIATAGVYPDLTIFLDLSPEDGIKRKGNEEKHDLDRLELEKLEFHHKVYEGYQEMCKKNPNTVKRIDASKSAEEVFEEIKRVLNDFFH